MFRGLSSDWVCLQLEVLREETQRFSDNASDISDFEDTPAVSPFHQLQDHHAFIFGYRSADVDLRQCHPPSHQVPLLWSVFQENVDPLAKVLHIPSAELIIREAKKNPSALGPGNEAIVFAIYFSAVNSLQPEEVCRPLISLAEVIWLS